MVALASAELREERDLSVAGFIRWALEPLSYMLVYVVLIGVVLERGQAAYPLFLLCALVPWRFFTGVALGSMSQLNKNSACITNRAFPREVLPLVLILTEGASYAIALLLLFPFAAYFGVGFSAALLWLLPVSAVLALLAAGPAYLLSVVGLYHPGYRGVIQNIVRVGFFASAGLVPLTEVPDGLLPSIIRANPLSPLFEAFRGVVMHGRGPALAELAHPLAVATVVLAVGVSVYRRRQFDFANAL